jgi:soluble lytic murein transglycosylase
MQNPVRLIFLAVLLMLTLGALPFTALGQDPTPESSSLGSANTALYNGDYAAAIQAYTDALSDPASFCPALYGLGLTHTRAAQPTDGEVVFTRYLTECEINYRALILRAQMRQQTGNFAGALEDYQQAITLQPGLLDSYLYEDMTAFDFDESVYFLRLAATADRQPEGKIILRERLAQVAQLVGNSTAALEQYNTILSEIDTYLTILSNVEGAEYDRNGEIRARVEAAAAAIELATNQSASGWERLQRIITSYSESSTALPSLIRLVTGAQSVDTLARMRVNVLNENYAPVVDVLTSTLNDPNSADSTSPELWLLLGRAQRGLGDETAAIATFQQLIQRFPDDPFAATALLEQGQAHLSLGQVTEAVATFTAIANGSFANSPEAPEGLFQAAEALEASGDTAAALSLYEMLATRYPDSDAAQTGMLEAATALRDTDPGRAATLYGQSATAQGLLWQGILMQQAGDTTGAQTAWKRATAADPGTLFSMRACELLNGLEPFAPSTNFLVNPITDADRQAAADWVEATFGLTDISPDISPELAADPMLRRGVELWSVGMWSDARAEFDALHKLRRSDPAALLQLAFYYPTVGVYRSSVYAATRLTFMSGVPFTQIPRAILQLAYPFYYTDLLITESQAYSLDPLMIAALIRQETSFDPFALSPANAYGLMQLLPATAQDVAGRMGQTVPTINDLYRPVENIPLGVYYFATMRDFHNGSVLGALLSYNAGPGAAAAWLEQSGNSSPELLYETIDYEETRQYLDFIYQNYIVYRYLYGDGVPACMFEAAQ